MNPYGINKPKYIKSLHDFYDALSQQHAEAELRAMKKNRTKEDELNFMYEKGSMDTYKNVIDILVRERIIERSRR